jgi:hypothetical protein
MAPVIQVGPGKTKYFFPLKDDQKDLSDFLNTDSQVDVCARQCVIENARVVSIVCGGTSLSKCAVVLELSKKEADELSSSRETEYRLVPRN